MIPISILGQPTKDDVAEGKRGRDRERGKDTYRADIFLMQETVHRGRPLSISSCPSKLLGSFVSSSNDSGPTQLELSEGEKF